MLEDKKFSIIRKLQDLQNRSQTYSSTSRKYPTLQYNHIHNHDSLTTPLQFEQNSSKHSAIAQLQAQKDQIIKKLLDVLDEQNQELKQIGNEKYELENENLNLRNNYFELQEAYRQILNVMQQVRLKQEKKMSMKNEQQGQQYWINQKDIQKNKNLFQNCQSIINENKGEYLTMKDFKQKQGKMRKVNSNEDMKKKNKLQLQYNEMSRQLQNVKNGLAEYQNKMKQYNRNQQQLNNLVEQLRQKNKVYEMLINSLRDKIHNSDQLANQIINLKNHILKLQNQNYQLKNDYQKYQKQFQKIQLQFQNTKKQLQTKNKYLQQQIKKILAQKQQFQNLITQHKKAILQQSKDIPNIQNPLNSSNKKSRIYMVRR